MLEKKKRTLNIKFFQFKYASEDDDPLDEFYNFSIEFFLMMKIYKSSNFKS